MKNNPLAKKDLAQNKGRTSNFTKIISILRAFYREMPMELNDQLYGKMEFPDWFGELLDSTAMQRLGRIHQSGAIFLVNPAIAHTRLEHSIGVMMLINMLGGSELEQLAGLFHDVSHTAFSHVGDYVFDRKAEDYHEQIFAAYLQSSEIPAILQRNGYEVTEIIHGQFPLLEQEMPALCADRVDYTLRDALKLGFVSLAEARSLLKSLSLSGGKMTLPDKEQALWLERIFERLENEFFQYPLYVYANQSLSNTIKRLLTSKELEEEDMMKDDVQLLNKIRRCSGGLEEIRNISKKGFQDFLNKGGRKMTIKPRFLQVIR